MLKILTTKLIYEEGVLVWTRTNKNECKIPSIDILVRKTVKFTRRIQM